MLIHGRRAKVLGRVSMDMTAVDVSGIRNVRVGDEVVLIGRQGREFIGADEVASKCGTTAYAAWARIGQWPWRMVGACRGRVPLRVIAGKKGKVGRGARVQRERPRPRRARLPSVPPEFRA